MGRGCRSGPGPGPTPVLSPGTGPDMAPDKGSGGDGRDVEDEAWLTALWFDGRMLMEDDELGAGGGGI